MSDAGAFEQSTREMAEAFARAPEVHTALGLVAGTLDFSKESLSALDGALPRLRALEEEPRSELAMALGAYLAEVVRRRAPVALRWVPASVLPQPVPDNPFVLATPKNLVFAVLSKPKALLAPGATDTLTRFASAIQELCSREATGQR